jgi:hypothetical protein
MMQMKRDLRAGDHAFTELDKDHSPEHLKREQYERLPGRFYARR